MMSKQHQGGLDKENWLTTWSQAQKGLGLFPINDNGHTVSYQIPIQNKGEKIRLSLGNYYGEAPVKINALTVSTKKDSDFKVVTVSGMQSFILASSETIQTDEIATRVAAEDTLYLRIYYPTQSETDRVVSGSVFGDFPERFEVGDYTQNNDFSVDLNYADTFVDDPYAMKFSQEFSQAKQRYTMTLQSVDVYSPEGIGTIVAFGDSITEQNHWVAPLQKEVLVQSNHQVSLVNAGISGNRLLRQIANLPRRAQYFGLAGIERFEHDVFEVNSNVKTVIIALGLNDIHQPGTDVFFSIDELPSFEEMIAGFEKLIKICRHYQARVFLATLSPFIGYAKAIKNDEKEVLRQQINEWIRKTRLSDGYYDFDTILTDNQNPPQLATSFDSGDKIHPSAVGGAAMTRAIDIEQLLA